MIPIKTAEEIKIMQKAGKIAALVRQELVKTARVGVSTTTLDQLAEKLIREHHATPSFKGYQGFPASIVTCLNEQVVHGIPSQRQLRAGDILTIDLGVYYQNLHVDTALTITIGRTDNPTNHFLNVGQLTLKKAIQECCFDKRVGDISFAIQASIEKAGLNVVRAFVGHGVGQNLHEEPQIPCFGNRNTGPLLKPNMTLAVEVMYTLGSGEVKVLKDGWTTVTQDSTISAMFEHTVAITNAEPLILTQ